ncbi:MAG: DNA repair exonuclease [Candidatus Woesearchaeota archaeon]
MKFAHMADVHIGSFRDEKLKELSMESFSKAIDICMEENIDFLLISGDLFNTALPSIENLKQVIKKLKELKNWEIPIYIIPGSHDYSPSGKTMIDVLEEAELLKNVVKGRVDNNTLKLIFTIDKKTGAKITGIMGKRGMLDKKYYEALDKTQLEEEQGFKIFMFHNAITELRSQEFEQIESTPLSLLPKNFDYYAGGHLHFFNQSSEDGYKNVVYPGPIFPTNFQEIEKIKSGSFVIYEDGEIKKIDINTKNVFTITINANNKLPTDVEEEIINKTKQQEFINTIITIRIEGKLREGKPQDIHFKEIFENFYNKGAFFVLKNTNKLLSKDYEDIKTIYEKPEEIEKAIIEENLGKIKVNFDEKEKAIELIKVFSKEKREEEKQYEYEKRIIEEANLVLNIDSTLID